MQKIILSEKEATAFFAPQGFVTKCFLIFILDEVKNFATNIFFQLVIEVVYWDPRKLVSHVLRSRASKGGTVITEQVQLSIEVRVQLQVGIRYWDSFTCNCLL